MPIVLYIVEIVVALGLIILVHELGHFLAAKQFGVRVRRFALGMGPAIIKWGKGETEYSLRCIPIGGFVDLVGEHPEAEEADDPRGLWRRPAWQKIIVFSAGVFMNALLAIVLFTLAPIVGVQAVVPIIGRVMPDLPAQKAGLEPGDRIVAIDGRSVQTFEEFQVTVALADAGTSFTLDIERPGPDDRPPVQMTKTVVSVPGSMFPIIGVESEQEPVIYDMAPIALLRKAGLKKGDRILTVNGQAVATWRAMSKAVADAPAGPVVLTIDRGGEQQQVRVVPADLKVYQYGLNWPTEITNVESGSPAAEAGLKTGDRIAAIEDVRWPEERTAIELIRKAGANALVHLKIWRDGRVFETTAKTAVMPGWDRPRIGIGLGMAMGAPVQAGHVDPGGAADTAGLMPGDLIRSAGEGGEPLNDVPALSRIVVEADGKPVPLQVERGGNIMGTTLVPKAVPQERLSAEDAMGPPLYAPLPRIYNPVVAAQRGIRHTGLWLGRNYLNLKQFMTGQVSTKAAGGPVAIVQWSYNVAAHGTGAFLDFLGMLTISIAVLNFLPIPPFDGGHVLFVIIDKIKRRPVGLKVRTVVWIVGWIAVLMLFVVVTYRDILRVIS